MSDVVVIGFAFLLICKVTGQKKNQIYTFRTNKEVMENSRQNVTQRNLGKYWRQKQPNPEMYTRLQKIWKNTK